jgi:hypothetical protein
MSERPGRNDPCPCGSGSKYKKCCLEKDEAARVAAAASSAAAVASAGPATPAPVARAKQQAQKPQEASRKMQPAARRRSV